MNIKNDKVKNENLRYNLITTLLYEKKLYKLRQEVNQLFFNHHFSKSMIASRKKVSRNFVGAWTKSPIQNFTQDRRGWLKGRRRKWKQITEKRIQTIHRFLTNNVKQFYSGATAVEQEWRKRYPQISPPPLRTIGQILSDLGCSDSRQKNRNKGAARYLCYPEYTIYTLLGGRILEADFVGKKYISGQTEPLNFIGFSFKKEPKLRYFKRISGQTAHNFINQCQNFFEKFEKPDFLKIDNSLAVIGSASGKRNVSKVMNYLLKNQVVPIFAVPRQPFSQASIEGNNSVFSKKFWNQIEFKNIQEVDKKLEWFNLASQKYSAYQTPQTTKKEKKKFQPQIYFIRQVKEDKEQNGQAFIDILNEKIFLAKPYINYFVLAKWDLPKEQLYIYFEKEQRPVIIKKLTYKINPKSKEKFKELY